MKVNVAVCPGGTDPVVGEAVTVKSGAAITTIIWLDALPRLFPSPW